MAAPPSSTARNGASAPPYLPIGVRAIPVMTGLVTGDDATGDAVLEPRVAGTAQRSPEPLVRGLASCS
jgi:hypothetical protein